MKDISGLKINEDAIIVGISASGLWMLTTKYARARMAWMPVKLAWRTLRKKRLPLTNQKEKP